MNYEPAKFESLRGFLPRELVKIMIWMAAYNQAKKGDADDGTKIVDYRCGGYNWESIV